MFTSVSIKNFRGFTDLTVEPLGRVNLIAGKNNTGKTSLLEALFLYAGANNPEIAYRLGLFRGIPHVSRDASEMWGWLFHRKNVARDIVVSIRDEANGEHSVLVKLAEPTVARLKTIGCKVFSSPSSQSLSTPIVKRDLLFEHTAVGGQQEKSRAYFDGDVLNFEGALTTPVVPVCYQSPTNRNPATDAERFSKLETMNRSAEVLNVLRLIEPDMQRLSIGLISGYPPFIQGDIGLGEQVPLALMGDGMVRLLSVVLGILDLPTYGTGGIALLDEIENGIHHSAMKKVWLAIATAARQSDVQVFATTHSYECVQAAHEAFTESGPYDLRVHRLERVKGTLQAITFDQSTLGTSLELGWEIR